MIFNVIKRLFYKSISDKDYRELENKLSECVKEHELFQGKLPEVLFYFLLTHELIRRGKHIPILMNGLDTDYPEGNLAFISQGLETALYIAYAQCSDEEIKVSRDIYKIIYDKYRDNLRDPEIWFLLRKHSLFEYCQTLRSRGYFIVRKNKGIIYFFNKGDDIFKHIAYGYKRLRILNTRRSFLHATKEFLRINESDIRDIDKTIHDWLYRTKFLPNNIRIPYNIISNIAVQSVGKMRRVLSERVRRLKKGRILLSAYGCLRSN